VIRAYQESIGQGHRDIVLLPASAHGTNPASAIQCGYKTVTVKCDENGNIDLEDFRAKAEENKERLAASMITYPSTHGIFEVDIKVMRDIVHACGGQLYMDGANMNAQVGLTNPGTIGADVCHLNLHKTFSSPHGGGGPGVGPICVAEHLVPFLPQHPVLWGSDLNTVSAAPYGSAGILPITYAYIRLLGTEGLETVTKTAILNANYLAAKFKDTYGIVYTGATGRVGHELILECRTVKERSGIDEGDIAKRDGLRLPRSYPIFPGTRHLDGRADREREQGRAGSFRRGNGMYLERDQGGGGRQGFEGGQRLEERPASGIRGDRRRVETRVSPHEGRLPAGMVARQQVLD